MLLGGRFFSQNPTADPAMGRPTTKSDRGDGASVSRHLGSPSMTIAHWAGFVLRAPPEERVVLHNLKQLSTMDILALATMKNAAKCDT